jgi:uncharacterized protein YceK
MRKLLTPFFVLFFVAGCASADLLSEAETPEQKYWAALNIFDTYDSAALHIAQGDPNTPVTVKQGLKRARNTAKEALLIADVAYNILLDTRESLAASPGDESQLETLNAALAAFNARSIEAFARVESFARAVDRIQE